MDNGLPEWCDRTMFCCWFGRLWVCVAPFTSCNYKVKLLNIYFFGQTFFFVYIPGEWVVWRHSKLLTVDPFLYSHWSDLVDCWHFVDNIFTSLERLRECFCSNSCCVDINSWCRCPGNILSLILEKKNTVIVYILTYLLPAQCFKIYLYVIFF